MLNDEPIRIYVPLLMRPWVMQACHSTAFCHLGTMRTLRMLERFYWWIGMSIFTWWWLRHCLKRQARKTSRLTVRWPVISMPLPKGLDIAVSVDNFGPLPVTPRGNTYILFFTDRFSRRADMYAVTAAEFTAEGTANILINRYTPLWGCPSSILSGQRPPVLLKAFTGGLQASWRSENCHQLLPPKWQWRGGTCESRDGPNAGNGGQRAPK